MAGTTTPPAAPPTPPVKPPMPNPPTPPAEVVALGQLIAVLGNDPKYRPRVLELMREADPTLSIPELDVRKAVEEKVTATATELKQENTKLMDRLGALERSIARDRWATENDLDEDEMSALEKFAVEKKIGDPSAALDYFRRSDLGRPRGAGSRNVEMTEESRKELYKNPRAWALKRGEEIIAELRRSGRRGA